jgi:hypothetical protein
MDEIAVKFAIAKILRSEVQDLNKGTNELTEIYKLMEEQLRLKLIAFSECVVKDVTIKGHEEVVDYFLKKHKAINCG